MKLFLIFLVCYLAFSVRVKDDKPINLDVTYEHPWKDLNERKKFYDEFFKYTKKTKEVEKKLTGDMELLKMLFNIQNNQILQLRQIIEVNKAILNQLELKK
jgi:hypothetical protein